MHNLLEDLYAHQAWADRTMWEALDAQPEFLADDSMRDRLYHLHIVQRAFLLMARHETVKLPRPEELQDAASLRAFSGAYHNEAAQFLARVTDHELAGRIIIPWFKDPPLSITVEQALLHAALHSQHHRGQILTKFRELGGKPPMTDFVVWLWEREK